MVQRGDNRSLLDSDGESVSLRLRRHLGKPAGSCAVHAEVGCDEDVSRDPRPAWCPIQRVADPSRTLAAVDIAG
jgi:hypothetical protein